MKDNMYREMDRNYYDMKDYVRHRINRHEKKSHMKVEVDETELLQSQENVVAAVAAVAEPVPPTEHIIIIDENTVFSDDE
jgi:hypothetical protein